MSKISEIGRILSSLDDREQKDLEAAINSGNDRAFTPLRKIRDRFVDRALRTRLANMKAEGEVGDSTELKKRLDRIKQGYERKAEEIRLQYHGREVARDSGVPLELLDGLKFESEQDAEERVGKLRAVMDARDAETRSAMMGKSFKPGAGVQAETPTRLASELGPEYAEAIRQFERYGME